MGGRYRILILVRLFIALAWWVTVFADAQVVSSGKIGLLPKRSVSLVSTESQPGRAHDEEEEELEYVENPFEEGKYS